MGAPPTTTTLPPPAPPPGRRTLPLGVAILSFLLGLYGFVVFVIGLLLFVKVAAIPYLHAPSTFGLKGYELAAIVTVFGLLILGIAVALWRLRLWALVLALIVLLYELVVYGLAGAFISFGFIVALLLFLYLIAVHRHFD